MGLTAGILASMFRLALKHAESFRNHLSLRVPEWQGFALALGLGAIGGGVALWLVKRFAPEAGGSGIQHIEAVLQGQAKIGWKRLLPVKFVSGLLGIGSGFALGREGPTIQMGSSCGMLVARWFKVTPGEGERKALISAGAGAGLAGAFNAPLSGMMFVLEELHVKFTPVVLVATFLAAVSADIVTRILVGAQPVFLMAGMTAPTLTVLPGALVVGVLAGFGGIAFNRGLLFSLNLYDKLHSHHWPVFVVGAITGGLMGAMGWAVPGLAGSGYVYVEQALIGNTALALLPLLLLARFVMTMMSYGSGAAGGIFGPLLVLGSLGGLALGGMAHAISPSWFPNAEVFAVLGMGALFTSVARAPLTSLVLMIELTGIYAFMLPLLVSCLIAYGVAEALGVPPIYESLRKRALENGTFGPSHKTVHQPA